MDYYKQFDKLIDQFFDMLSDTIIDNNKPRNNDNP